MSKPTRALSLASLIGLSIGVTIILVLINNIRFDSSLRSLFERDHGLYDQTMVDRSQNYLLNVLPVLEHLRANPRDSLKEQALEQIDMAYAFLNVGRYIERYQCTEHSLNDLLAIRSSIEADPLAKFDYQKWEYILRCYSEINLHQNEIKARLVNRVFDESQSSQYWMNVGIIIIYALGILLWCLLELQRRKGHKSESEKVTWQARALTDHLTSTYNRMALHDHLENIVSQWPNSNESVALVFYDIDYFKPYNDRFGHVAGDDALRQVTCSINKVLPKGADHFRFGGEEFFIINRDCDHGQAVELGDRMLEAVRDLKISHPCSDAGILTISVGIYMMEQREYTVDELIKKVDELLYVAKDHGRNRLIDESAGNEAS